MIHSVKETDGSAELTFVPPAQVSDEYRELCWLGSREAVTDYDDTLLTSCARAVESVFRSDSVVHHHIRLNIADRSGHVSPHIHMRLKQAPGIRLDVDQLRRLDDVFSKMVDEQSSGCLLDAA
jgi:hypothetical protein